jgi:YD repeat-containing protein
MRPFGRLALVAVALLSWLVPAPADAFVARRNGNFTIGYTDVTALPGFGMLLERVYNSKSSFSGMFGFGWGSDYEVYLGFQADGAIVVHQNGGGANASFTPPKPDEGVLRAAVQALSAARRQAGDLAPDALRAYEERLGTDERFRHDEWERLRGVAGITPRDLPVGTQLTSNNTGYNGHQVLTRVAGGYRLEGGGPTWEFDDKGRFVRVSDANGHWVTAERNANGQLKTLKDDLGATIALDLDAGGHLVRAISSNGITVRYRFQGAQLVYSKDTKGNEYSFAYDDRNNMVRVGYFDGSELVVAYDPVEQLEGARLLRDRDGSLTLYERYGSNDAAAMHIGLSIEGRAADGAVVSRVREESIYRIKRSGTGRYVHQEIAEEDGSSSTTTYDESNHPLEIVKNGARTVFRYDDKGRMTYREDATSTQELTYASVGKVSRAQITSRDAEGKTHKTTVDYRYDARANLKAADTADGVHIELGYDKEGRIVSMKGRGDKATAGELRLEYPAVSWHPTRMTAVGTGSIRVTYDANGEIVNTESEGGRAVALKITSMYGALLDAIRPAGVRF